MPVILLSVLAIILVLWMAAGRRGRVNRCAWERVPGGTANLQEYKCQSCKVTAYASGGQPPKECKRGLGGSL